MALLDFTRLKKELGLFDVYVIGTGAMISAGFFLLPGIAAGYAGPGVLLAYLLSGILVIPALLSMAELATAMPRAGGNYYFLDRTLGPLVGTIGGFGTWIALVLKSAFALIGMGYYLGLVTDLPVVATALALTVVFIAVNVRGARQSSGLLRILVIGLLVVLFLFILVGMTEIFSTGGPSRARFTPLLPHGFDGLLTAVGLVFISYVGLTKVASLAEEVEHPDRNLPLGMILALLTVTTIYIAGVFVMVSVLGIDGLQLSRTPAAEAAEGLARWLPRRVAIWMMVLAAVAAFASAANAGIMAASRYPLAMARDRVVPGWLATTGAGGSPVRALLLTGIVLALVLVVLDVEQVAKLASAVQLLLFALISVAVIVMRESGIESYDPGFRSPFYPWMQLVGLFVPVMLVAELGWVPVLFTIGVTVVCVGWYTYYAKAHIARDGAIYHVFARLGRRRYAGLDRELRDLMKEKGLRAEDPFDEVVARASVIDCESPTSLKAIIRQASELLERRLPIGTEEIFGGFGRGVQMGGTPVAHGAALLHMRLPDLETSEMVLVRCIGGVRVDVEDVDVARQAALVPIQAVFFLVSGEADPGRHLRILAQLAGRVEEESFMPAWLSGRHEQELKETLIRDERFLSLKLVTGSKAEALVGHPLHEVELPPGCLIALIRRYGDMLVPRGRTILREGDRLTIIGSPAGLRVLAERYGGGRSIPAG
ncbi:MAG: amino acid permease [Gemmatimonadota bacterium]|nr:amino acid permease [Gemmatimonadota bacterium]MDH3368745.1 amino acid permease [Gemmatimonadota bacterium]MDH3479827.1 amino acid permease [Gemmatimonadota bacterium]MDH3569455.1 amino acid permease [Gemmatimonadota bacterium]MDH5550075.1 amino acid permease [Gemmatimonadota bacterium]